MLPLLALALAAVPDSLERSSTSAFASDLTSLDLRAEVGSGISGDSLTGNVGILSLDLRDFGRRWVVSWDAQAGLVLGGVAYEHPYDWLYGITAEAHAEGGWRLCPRSAWSAYLSAGLDGAFSALAEPGVSLGSETVNNLDNLGGVIGSGGVRLGAGVSYLSATQSFLVELQPLAELETPQQNLPFSGFFGAALHARYDLRDRLAALGEASYAATPSQATPALHETSAAGVWTLSATAVGKLSRHFFAGAELAVARTATDSSYAGGLSYTTDTPVESRFSLLLGYWP